MKTLSIKAFRDSFYRYTSKDSALSWIFGFFITFIIILSYLLILNFINAQMRITEQIGDYSNNVACNCDCNNINLIRNDSDELDFNSSAMEPKSTRLSDNDKAEQTEGPPTSTIAPNLPQCSHKNVRFTGALNTKLIPEISDTLGMHEVERKLAEFSTFGDGPHWKPTECVSKQKVAIIVPFRTRHAHLARLILWLTPILKRQLLEFFYIVVEQYGDDLYNKGRLMNAAFLMAVEKGANCVIFQDVDLLPIDDRVWYRCKQKQPVHIGAFVDKLGNRLWYENLVGGVLAMTPEQFTKVNGYSNLYWGWGAEDDDMGLRLMHYNYTIARLDSEICRFTMLDHVDRKKISKVFVGSLLTYATQRIQIDGLRQEKQFWRSLGALVQPLYYHLYIDCGIPPADVREIEAQKELATRY